MKKLISIISLVLFFGSAWSHAWTRTQTFEPNHQPCPGCKTKAGTIGERAQFGASDTTYSKDYVHSGKQSSKNYIANGSTGKNWGGSQNFSNSLTEGGELWFRKYVYFPKDYSFSADPVAKFIRFSSGQLWISLLWNADGSIRASNPVTSGAQGKGIFKLDKGRWQAVEMYVKFSSKRGAFRVWKDGKLVFEDTSSATLKGGDKSSRMIWGTYWNGGAPKSQSHYVDDMVWTTDTPSQRDSKGNAFIGLTTGSVASSQPEPEVKSPPQPPKITSN